VDYVTPGTHALTCPPADPAALRQRLDVLRGDGPATRTLSEEGRARVLDALTTSHFAERIADILLDVGSQR
jgi:glycosyltransferase involved in cell wall biosynthesis